MLKSSPADVIDMLAVASIRPLVEAFLEAHPQEWSPTRLSREATRDPAKIARMRAGMQFRPSTARQFLEKIEAVDPGFVKNFVLASATLPGHGLK